MIDAFARSYAPAIEAALDRWLPPADAEPARLHAAMRYAVFGGGKRLRPLCCLLGAAACGGAPEAALPAAAALELIHTYSLVHDDLPCMDDDDLRRGRPTVHKAFDEATAVLAGDALLTQAFQVVAEQLEHAIAAPVAAVLARGAGSCGMVGGQVGDLEAEGRALARAEILAIDRRKTAALFAAAFECGGLCAGAPTEARVRLAELGLRAGIAFQIVDDLLDRRSTAEQLGKATGKDQERGKATLPALLGDEAAFEFARALSAEAGDLSRGLPNGELIAELIRSMLNRSR